MKVSDPHDRFEKEAEKSAAGQQSDAHSKPPARMVASPRTGPLFVQRFTDNSPDSNYTQRQTEAGERSASAGETSAVAGIFSAAFSGISAFEAVRQAGFAGRQAETAEDPPVATPTTTGVTANDVDIPESKGLEAEHMKKEGYDETETVDEEKQYGVIKNPDGSDRAAGGKNPHRTIKRTHKEAEKPDQEQRLHVLRVTQGATDSADFYVNLLFNGTDIKGGTTEQGEFKGYKGGTNNSNLSVNFRASKGRQMAVPDPDKKSSGEAQEAKPGEKPPEAKADADSAGDLAGTVRFTFRGTNAPPRKTVSHGAGAGLASFFFGGGGVSENKNYDKQLQNFNGAVRFTGKGTAFADNQGNAKPADKGNVSHGPDGTNGPLVTVSMGGAAAASANAAATTPPPQQAQVKAGGAANPSAGGNP